MSQLDEKLNQLLGDPAAMAQVMQLAQQLSGTLGEGGGGGSPPPSPPPCKASSSSRCSAGRGRNLAAADYSFPDAKIPRPLPGQRAGYLL